MWRSTIWCPLSYSHIPRVNSTLTVMAKNMMLYWGSGSPPCWRVMIALEEKKLQGYNHKLLSFDKKEHQCAEVKALNPRVQVRLWQTESFIQRHDIYQTCVFNIAHLFILQLPTFKHGDLIVNESFAACLYLEVNHCHKHLRARRNTSVPHLKGILQVRGPNESMHKKTM